MTKPALLAEHQRLILAVAPLSIFVQGITAGHSHHNGVQAGKALWQRIEERAMPEPNSGCWLWVGSWDKDGYGLMSIADRTWRVHRVAYELAKGRIPAGLQIDHKCRVRCCVNPDHLEAVTGRENTLRGDTRPAANSKKTHCKYGHDLANAVVYRTRFGFGRSCRTCKMLASRERRRAKRCQ